MMTVRKDDLLRVARIFIADSNYKADIQAIKGFMLGSGFDNHSQLETYLRLELGEDYPDSLPDNWLYAEGL